MVCVRVVRMSGEVMEIHLADLPRDEHVCAGYVKMHLAKASPRTPTACVVRLIGTDAKEMGSIEQIATECLEQGVLQYALVDVMSLTPLLLDVDPFHLIFPADPKKLMDTGLVIDLAHEMFEIRGRDVDVCQRFFCAWTEAVMDTSKAEANQVEPDGCTLLTRMLALWDELQRRSLQSQPWDGPPNPFGSCALIAVHMTTNRFAVEKMQVQTLEQTFQTIEGVLVDATFQDLNALNLEPFHVVFPADPKTLMDPALVINLAHGIFKTRGRDVNACQKFFSAWTKAVMGTSKAEANQVEPDGRTLLTRMLVLLKIVYDPIPSGQGQCEFGDDFLLPAQRAIVRTMIWLVRKKLHIQTVEKTFHVSPYDEMMKLLWTFVQDKLSLPRGAGHHSGLVEGYGADLMLALIDRGLPRRYWAGCFGPFDDNLLQYILESTCNSDPYEHTEAEGRLSIALAKKYTLEELCHQSFDGYSAIFYAERVAREIEDRWPVNAPEGFGIWVQLRDVVREQLQVCAGGFQGTLCELAALAGSVRMALGGQSLPAFDEQLWVRASVVRQQWLSMGWRFTRRDLHGQTSEVVSWHFQAARQGHGG
ncbi:unnamed protein product [Symbiodinium natans]|uniref:Uncharacterized protein n=1 Tax=Symbiodinium natans TaxID=878477 RepID=A0A812V7I2_9DINO|nr:unnamed protein product [Symbiodinium natans]